jgi:GT2 family glycosyltransferase
MLTDVGCVVVHHNNYPTVLITMEAILAGGVPAGQIILVDNSEDARLATALKAELPTEVRFLTQTNSGYGHAANAGVAELLARHAQLECILVSTHEAIPDVSAIAIMLDALRSCNADAVGPTLFDGANSGCRVWSTGGEVSRILNIPFHTRIARNVGDQDNCVDRAWLDGAFCLYRADALAGLGFREEYFLYFEEVDLHMQIQKAGGRVIWAPAAHVSQISSGIPPYYLTRNMVIFQSRHGNSAQRLLAPTYSLLRSIIRTSLRERKIPDLRELGRGLLDGSRLVRGRAQKVVAAADSNVECKPVEGQVRSDA